MVMGPYALLMGWIRRQAGKYRKSNEGMERDGAS